jgi:SAM-dependent methyltransferase
MTDAESEVFAGLESWYTRANGQYLLENVRLNLEKALERAFGYHILQLGVTRHHPMYDQSPVNHRIYSAQRAGDGIGLIAHCEELPLESDSIDILIAHHSLEFEANPHGALREMQRVLAPQGQLFIIGFNPYSAFGIGACFRGLSRNSAWHHHHPVGSHRVSDWLHLLGCEVQNCSYLFAVPPLGSGRLRSALASCDGWLSGHNIPLGGLYVLHAIKQVSAIHRPRRRLLPTTERLMGLAVAKPRTAPAPTPSIHTPPITLPREGDVAA